MISSTNKAFLIIALASIASMIVGTSLIQTSRVNAQAGQFARAIQTFQNSTHIIITIAKAPKADEPLPPIVVIPPNTTSSEPKNNVTEKGNETLPSDSQKVNETQPSGGNTTVIEPDQNVTVVPLPPNSNVTQVDNGTIIIAPPDRNITQTPGNVTVIDPPQCTCKLHHGHGHHGFGKLPPSGNQSVGVAPPAAGNTTNTNESGVTPKPPMTAGNTTNSSTSGLSLSAATMKALHHR